MAKAKRILVADDEMMVRQMLMDVLSTKGYSVSVVDNGLDMVRLASTNRSFDLIISDVNMPMGEGNDLLALLREKGVKTPAILITGKGHAFTPKGVPLLEKPIHPQELLKLATEMMANGEDE
ncbi:MAG: response regulator transcription factor [Planctomycetota bacterium]|jgi:DNA-binding NtrC family response regulator